jgi:hypothetical protein
LLIANHQRAGVAWAAALVIAALAAWAWARVDPLPPVPYVEGIVGLARQSGPAWMVASLAALALLPLPFFVGPFSGHPAVARALGAYLCICILAPLFGNFPVPLVGFGLSPIVGYFIALAFARWNLLEFSRAMIPAQAVAVSTQSSLASLPAMVGAARRLGVREENSDVTLPLAVALFRATGPAMNIAVAIYVAYWLRIDLSPWQLFAGIAMASVASYWAVSLPGQLSFVTSIAPIALAMGLPVEPLAILIAVETFPDIVRTLGNVTLDVAVTGAVARKTASAD